MLRLPELELLHGPLWTPPNKSAHTLVVYWWASWCPFCAVPTLSIDKHESAASGYVKSKGYTLAAGMMVLEVAKMLSKLKGRPLVMVLRANGRKSTAMFAEGGEMFPEDIEGLKKYI